MTPKKFSKIHKINYKKMIVYDLPKPNDLKKVKLISLVIFLNGVEK